MFYTTYACHTPSSVIRQNCTTNQKSDSHISTAYFLCNFSQQYPETLEQCPVFLRQASVNSQTMDQWHSKHVVIQCICIQCIQQSNTHQFVNSAMVSRSKHHRNDRMPFTWFFLCNGKVHMGFLIQFPA